MTLTDLDDSATTPNKVNVAIEYRPDTDDFKVISTGYYGVAKRKIEAIFEGVVTFGGGRGATHSTTRQAISRSKATTGNPVLLRDISVFAGGTSSSRV